LREFWRLHGREYEDYEERVWKEISDEYRSAEMKVRDAPASKAAANARGEWTLASSVRCVRERSSLRLAMGEVAHRESFVARSQ